MVRLLLCVTVVVLAGCQSQTSTRSETQTYRPAPTTQRATTNPHDPFEVRAQRVDSISSKLLKTKDMGLLSPADIAFWKENLALFDMRRIVPSLLEGAKERGMIQCFGYLGMNKAGDLEDRITYFIMMRGDQQKRALAIAKKVNAKSPLDRSEQAFVIEHDKVFRKPE